jgi:hypothetical protein
MDWQAEGSSSSLGGVNNCCTSSKWAWGPKAALRTDFTRDVEILVGQSV